MNATNQALVSGYLSAVTDMSGQPGKFIPLVETLGLLASAENASKMWVVLNLAGWVTFTTAEGKTTTLAEAADAGVDFSTLTHHVTDKMDADNWITKLQADYAAANPEPEPAAEQTPA